jgi:hypothetical protein
MLKRIPLIAAVGTVLLLTACGQVSDPTSRPSATPAHTSAPSATPTPTPSASAADDYATGTCTQADMQSDAPTPATYTIYEYGATSPITFQYMGFNKDGTNPILTATTSAAVTSIVAYPCTDKSGGQTWTLTATSTTADSLGCVLAYGGMLVRTDSKGGDDTHPFIINCSGNPGE